MALTTGGYNQPLYEASTQVTHPGPLYASANLWIGTLVCSDSGVIKPYTAALAVGGATFLGFPTSTIQETTGSNFTPPANTPFKFRRGTKFVCSGKSGDAPTASNLGGYVALYDNWTCQATLTSGYTQAILTEVRADGNFEVQLP